MLTYDFSFFETHARRRMKMVGPGSNVVSAVSHFCRSGPKAVAEMQFVVRGGDEDEYYSNGAYYKEGMDTSPLEKALNTTLPEDFTQFCAKFGECVIVTRGEPLLFFPVGEMVEDFEADVDIDIKEGRFFRFARYIHPLNLGLRRNDLTDAWEVVLCSHEILYSARIGPEGRENVIAPSFYFWLKRHIETNGYPEPIFAEMEDPGYQTVLEG